ncbi:MAG: DUF421 domain-containing protein [Chloroflexota bacterium]|nr:DUF421 domain-containing protein [Chloroflexota bacterium]
MDWNALLPQVSILEKILRPLVVYLFLLLAFRLTGKRELGQMTPFDLIVLLTISNVLQNAMIGPDDSLGGGLIGALSLLVTNRIVSRLSFRFPWLERALEGEPTPLVENGRVLHENLRREVITWTELARAIRKHGLDPHTDLPRIQSALLEEDGTVTMVLAPVPPPEGMEDDAHEGASAGQIQIRREV